MEAVRSAKYSLSAAVASTEGASALPEKDRIAPNQKSWPETAKRMEERGRGITEQNIGVAKGKKRRHAGGEQPGKRAKPDLLSAAANAQARACAAPSGPSLPPSAAN